MKKGNVFLYICMSLDGFIATKDDDISWLSMADKAGEDYGYTEFSAAIDAYIVGRKTYSTVLDLTGEFPQAQQYECYVISRKEREEENGIHFYNGDIEELIHKLTIAGKNVYCDGGGEIVKLLMDKNLIDEYFVFILPIVLGDGKRLFLGETASFKLDSLPPKHYDTGLVRLNYKRRSE